MPRKALDAGQVHSSGSEPSMIEEWCDVRKGNLEIEKKKAATFARCCASRPFRAAERSRPGCHGG